MYAKHQTLGTITRRAWRIKREVANDSGILLLTKIKIQETANQNASAKQMVPNFAHIGEQLKILKSSINWVIKTFLFKISIALKLMLIHVLIHTVFKLCRHQSAIWCILASMDFTSACITLWSKDWLMEKNFANRPICYLCFDTFDKFSNKFLYSNYFHIFWI